MNSKSYFQAGEVGAVIKPRPPIKDKLVWKKQSETEGPNKTVPLITVVRKHLTIVFLLDVQ